MEDPHITITGARQHNLRDISLRIPRDRLVVITGPSGSGKSSLAFDTLFAEGQRRYIESLSAYARQFLDRLQKPDVDFIGGLSPAIAIEQRSSASNPRSTIATTTEIFDFLRLLFASIGLPHNPKTGKPLHRMGVDQIVDRLLAEPQGTRLILLAPLVRRGRGEFRDVIEKIRRDGFVRARIDGKIIDLEPPPRLDKGRAHDIEAVVDRLVCGPEARARLTDSIEIAISRGGGVVIALLAPPDAPHDNWREAAFSNRNFDPDSGECFGDLTPRHFSFNSPLGACPRCHGLGSIMVVDEDLVIADPDRSLDKGAIIPWRRGARRLANYYRGVIQDVAAHYGAPLDRPWRDLDLAFRRAMLHGSGARAIRFAHARASADKIVEKPFEGVIPQMERLHAESESEATRRRIESFMARRPCPDCSGARFKPEILAVTVGGPWKSRGTDPAGKNIHQICRLSVDEALAFVSGITLEDFQRKIAGEVLAEITRRLRFLSDVGLGYLTLDRESGTLSGGEAQRIRLATQIGSGLTGVLYILDEPSIGLHQRDNDRLIRTLRGLRDLGNSVLVVEHDEDTIRAADHVIDLGPGAGVLGGRVVAEGPPDAIAAHETSATGGYLSGRRRISVPRRRCSGSGQWLVVRGARANNLKHISARFPLGALTCVTGVSGSGKSTLVNDVLSRALFRHFYGAKERPGEHAGIAGLDEIDKVITIDQSPLGRTPRSNPATYTGAFNIIRDLFAGLPSSRVRGYGPARFTFNSHGGRCEACQGAGAIRIPMHFLPDVLVTCETCGGRRFNRETLEITYKGRNISDILDMTVEEARSFFRAIPGLQEKLDSLAQVGLGYLRLGQPADTLSGGEAQRVKLSAELGRKQTGRTLYLLDEPTTGLHFADVELLVDVLLRLRSSGNTVIVIEHNLDVVKSADHVIDLGPEGGEAGGHIVASGTPEDIARCAASITGRFLAKHLPESSNAIPNTAAA